MNEFSLTVIPYLFMGGIVVMGLLMLLGMIDEVFSIPNTVLTALRWLGSGALGLGYLWLTYLAPLPYNLLLIMFGGMFLATVSAINRHYANPKNKRVTTKN